MNAPPMIDMIEATRLTREGRLEEAMAILRGALPSARSSAASSERDTGQKPAERTQHIIDMVPPSTETGGSWTSPQFRETPSAGRRAGMSRQSIPEALERVPRPDPTALRARARRTGPARSGARRGSSAGRRAV